MTRVPWAAGGLMALVLAACAGGAQTTPTDTTQPPPSQAAATAESSSTAQPRASATTQPSAGSTPTTVSLNPEFRLLLDEGGDINRVVVVGDEVWATAARSIVRVDTRTRKSTTIDSPVSAGAADSFGATAEAVWVGDFERGRVFRLHRTTGAVLSELSVARPVTFADAGGLILVGSGSSKTMVAIDPEGSEGTATNLPHELVAGDSAWGADRPGTVRRVHIETREVTSIDVVEPRGPGDCSVRGSSESLWLHCHGNGTVARIDPDTNSVVATLDVGGPVFGGVQHLEDWAFFIEGREPGAHDGRIVRVDLSTNQIDRIFDLGPEFDPNPGVVAADALWVPNAGSGELWVLPLADLLVE